MQALLQKSLLGALYSRYLAHVGVGPSRSPPGARTLKDSRKLDVLFALSRRYMGNNDNLVFQRYVMADASPQLSCNFLGVKVEEFEEFRRPRGETLEESQGSPLDCEVRVQEAEAEGRKANAR